MTRDKALLICLMIIQKLGLKLFTHQNKMKLKEQDLKYQHLNKDLKKLPKTSYRNIYSPIQAKTTYSSCTNKSG